MCAPSALRLGYSGAMQGRGPPASANRVQAPARVFAEPVLVQGYVVITVACARVCVFVSVEPACQLCAVPGGVDIGPPAVPDSPPALRLRVAARSIPPCRFFPPSTRCRGGRSGCGHWPTLGSVMQSAPRPPAFRFVFRLPSRGIGGGGCAPRAPRKPPQKKKGGWGRKCAANGQEPWGQADGARTPPPSDVTT